MPSACFSKGKVLEFGFLTKNVWIHFLRVKRDCFVKNLILAPFLLWEENKWPEIETPKSNYIKKKQYWKNSVVSKTFFPRISQYLLNIIFIGFVWTLFGSLPNLMYFSKVEPFSLNLFFLSFAFYESFFVPQSFQYTFTNVNCKFFSLS